MAVCWFASVSSLGFSAWAISTDDYVFAAFMAVLALCNAAAAAIVSAAFRKFNW